MPMSNPDISGAQKLICGNDVHLEEITNEP